MADERLKVFLTVARQGSISGAARELYVSQPAVSLQIRKLEADYKTALFYRQERGVKLTPEGETLYRYAVRIEELYEMAGEELEAARGEFTGALHIAATLTIGEYVLPPIMGRFKSEHPAVEIVLAVENTQHVVETVSREECDLGLIEGPFDSRMIRAEKLTDDELVVVCSPQCELARLSPVSLDDLRREPLILREPGSGTRAVFEQALANAGVSLSELNVLMQLGSTHAIKSLVAQNLGVSVLSQWTVREEIERGTLHRVNVPALDLRRTFSFILRREARLSQVGRLFVEMCREGIAGSEH